MDGVSGAAQSNAKLNRSTTVAHVPFFEDSNCVLFLQKENACVHVVVAAWQQQHIHQRVSSAQAMLLCVGAGMIVRLDMQN